MARKITEIYKQIVDSYVASCIDAGIAVTDPVTWRLVSRRRLWANAQAFAIWIMEVLFDEHVKDIDETISKMKPHSPEWYVEHAKKFQYGFALIPGTDQFDNTGKTEAEIAVSKIIAYAAFVQEPFVRLKVAKLIGNNLAPLDPDELAAFWEYIRKTKDAGVKLKQHTVTSTNPDKLYLKLLVKYDVLVLNEDGSRRDGSIFTPVPDAIRSYLSNLDFNGLYSLQQHIDNIQNVQGVKDLRLDNAMTKYGALAFKSINISFVPDSGYLVIDDADLLITYEPF